MQVVGAIFVVCALVVTATATDDNDKKIILSLANQIMMGQLAREENMRSDGNSGIKQVRVMRSGTRPYFQATFGDGGVSAIHNHANNIRTVGMGEFMAVLNGIEFRTRHNDYRLFQPSKTSKEYHAKDPIEFPDVPAEVLEKKTVEEQLAEMRLFFKAWKEQNDTIRDYKPYFRPVLCYLEGAWTKAGAEIDEPFDSDRHFLDASSWFDLHQKLRFSAYTGRKSPSENYAYMPTSLMGMINDTIPDIAQWNYRIMCQPLKDHLPLNKLRVVDDLAARMKFNIPLHKLHLKRYARFQLSPDEDPSTGWPKEEQFTRKTLLDDLMGQIPGKDNGPADILDDAFDTPVLELGQTKVKLNSGYYHRWFEFGKKDAMGISMQRRGYADDQLFMAMTTHPKIASQTTEKCQWIRQKWSKKKEKVCKSWPQRWSYAIPLEIIYLTPLQSWNPYDLEYKGSARNKTVASSVTTDADGNRRTGQCSESGAYNGIHSKLYYLTPPEFYSGDAVDTDAADTTRGGGICVLDKNKTVRRVKASGTQIFLPPIAGVGPLRTRYPIMPIYGEGNSVYKELTALTDILKNGKEFVERMLLKERPSINNASGVITFVMSPSEADFIGEHTHVVTLTSEEILSLSTKKNQKITKITTEANGHSHTLVLRWKGPGELWMIRCDDKRACFDKHGRLLTMDDDS